MLTALRVRDAAGVSLASDGPAVALGPGGGCDAGGGSTPRRGAAADGLYAWGNAVHQALGCSLTLTLTLILTLTPCTRRWA